jgi:hypothetical protein
MDSSRIIHGGLLEGKTNWNTRKYKISACRRSVSGVMDVVQGRSVALNAVPEGATAAQTATYSACIFLRNSDLSPK